MTEKPKPPSPSQVRAERQRAAEVPPSGVRRPRDLDEWQDFISQAIEDAMRDGAFDNLPGKGKPLNLNENPNEPPDMAMANKILKNNDVTPPWIGDRKKLLEDVESLRADISQRWEWMRTDWAAPTADRARLAARWTGQIAVWTGQIDKLNSRILDLNLTLPIWRMELLRVHLADELARIGAAQKLGGEE
ncbi:MAG: DUF1992 domain-containing protein [Chloroflexi bacterium]|nr:MAG: DUF1992 domain-containing protein [Chloroflexota bacterium]